MLGLRNQSVAEQTFHTFLPKKVLKDFQIELNLNQLFIKQHASPLPDKIKCNGPNVGLLNAVHCFTLSSSGYGWVSKLF